MTIGTDEDVVEDGQVRKQAKRLNRAGDPERGELVWPVPPQWLTTPPQHALAGAHESADDVEQRGLAGPVGADHADDLAGRHRRRYIRESSKTAEAHRHVFDV